MAALHHVRGATVVFQAWFIVSTQGFEPPSSGCATGDAVRCCGGKTTEAVIVAEIGACVGFAPFKFAA